MNVMFNTVSRERRRRKPRRRPRRCHFGLEGRRSGCMFMMFDTENTWAPRKKLKKAAKKKGKSLAKALRLIWFVLRSSSSSSDSSESIPFVMDMAFSGSGKTLDPRNPDARIQRALGLSCGAFSFIERKDDEEVSWHVAFEAL